VTKRVKKPLAIVLDLDDCIYDFRGYLCRMHNKLHKTSITANDIKSWDFNGISVEDVRGHKVTGEQLYETFKKLEPEGLYWVLPLLPNAKDALIIIRKLGYRIVMLTAREEVYRNQSIFSIHHNDLPFDEVVFNKDKAKEIRKLSKTYNIRGFIDDKLSTVEDVEGSTNVNMCFLVETAATRDLEVDDNIIVVKDFFECTRYLKEVK
jgi:hypothetical protein